jgi:RNA polymerase sigma factor (TIGR02999 family)
LISNGAVLRAAKWASSGRAQPASGGGVRRLKEAALIPGDTGMTPDRGTITYLLVSWSNGDEQARDALLPLVYDELHRLAVRQFARERPGHLWQPTALVHEAYERLIDLRAIRWQDRAHFYAMAARIMRRLLVDHARQQRAAKRGAGRSLLALDEALVMPEQREVDLLILDGALTRLEELDARQAQVVELRFFVGLTHEEIAHVLAISVPTVKREWTMARTWLKRQLSGEVAS